MTEFFDLFDEKTRPWKDDEVIRVNGVPCCYTVIKNQGYLVHLPGGIKQFAHDLIAAGKQVVLPEILRKGN